MTNVIEEKLNKLSLGYITKKSCLFEKYMTIQIYGSDVKSSFSLLTVCWMFLFSMVHET